MPPPPPRHPVAPGERRKRVGVAYRSRNDFPERLRAALGAFIEIVAEEPAAAGLVVVDSLSLGAAGVEPREKAVEAFELMFRQSFEQARFSYPRTLQLRTMVEERLPALSKP